MIEVTQQALERLRTIRAFALDMDGTVYLGARLLPGAKDFVEGLRNREVPFVFLTNNSSRSRREYVAKLRAMGLSVGSDGVMTSGEATIRLLAREHPGRRVFLVATRSFEEEVREAGVRLVDEPSAAEVAVFAFDTSLPYARLATFCDIVRNERVPFLATHPDINCPVDGGYIPDVGAFLALIEASTGRRPDGIVGKPNRGMVTALCERLGFPAEKIAYIGDRLYTDVAMARNTGMLSVLVLSGETSRTDLTRSDLQPDVVFEHLGELNGYLGVIPETA